MWVTLAQTQTLGLATHSDKHQILIFGVLEWILGFNSVQTAGTQLYSAWIHAQDNIQSRCKAFKIKEGSNLHRSQIKEIWNPQRFLDLAKQIKLSNLLTKNQVVTLNQTIPHEGHQAFAKRYLNNSREATFYRLKTEVYHHDSRLETAHWAPPPQTHLHSQTAVATWCCQEAFQQQGLDTFSKVVQLRQKLTSWILDPKQHFWRD